MRKIPMRSCIVTKEKLPKYELFRIVRTPEQKIIIDLKGKENGRGAYLKKELEVIEKAFKSKILEKHLGIQVPIEIYEKLKELI